MRIRSDRIKHGPWWLLMLLCWQAATQSANAQSEADAVTETPAAVLTLPADTEIHLRMLEPVASNTHQRADRFKLEVVEAVVIDGQEVIPAGCAAEGEVVHSAKPGMGGKAGELILATRLLRLGEQQIRLRSFNAGTGQNRYNLANGLGVALGLPSLFVKGKNISVPSGTDVYAKVASSHQFQRSVVTTPPEAEDHASDDDPKPLD